MITYQTDGTRMPDIKKRPTTAWIRSVAATYGKKVGDVAEVTVPAGKLQFKILEISL
jgi:hypothetical protein